MKSFGLLIKVLQKTIHITSELPDRSGEKEYLFTSIFDLMKE